MLQDVDNNDKRSQQSRVVSVQIRVPSYLKARYGDLIEQLMAAAANEDRHQNHQGPREDREPSKHTKLKWRGGSFTTTEQQRQQGVHQLIHQLRGQEQSSAPTSELQERDQDRSSRKRSPREELSQSAHSTVPFRLSTREELQLHQLFSHKAMEEFRQSVSSEEL